eukprot:14256432-Alexandrium_andersonii.AAC.1
MSEGGRGEEEVLPGRARGFKDQIPGTTGLWPWQSSRLVGCQKQKAPHAIHGSEHPQGCRTLLSELAVLPQPLPE